MHRTVNGVGTKHQEVSNAYNPPLSYAAAVEPKLRSTISRPSEEYIQLKAGNFIFDQEDTRKVVLAHVKEFSFLSVLNNMCKAQGFVDVDIKYIRGMWLLLEFQSVKACYNFRGHEVVRSWFHQFFDWNCDFESKERLVWLDVEGLPIRAWSKTNFISLILK